MDATQAPMADGTGLTFRGLSDAASRALRRAQSEGNATWLHRARADFWNAMSEPNKAELAAKLRQLASTCEEWAHDLETRA